MVGCELAPFTCQSQLSDPGSSYVEAATHKKYTHPTAVDIAEIIGIGGGKRWQVRNDHVTSE